MQGVVHLNLYDCWETDMAGTDVGMIWDTANRKGDFVTVVLFYKNIQKIIKKTMVSFFLFSFCRI